MVVNTQYNQYTDDEMWNHIPETCIILLANVTPIDSITNKKEMSASDKSFSNLDVYYTLLERF